ncbi:MAG TPA: histidine kinase dimerization/phospho-acceptor domain-containing protein [Pyrinomonadaceae bacterium]|nr:histidine kinase dimerization/phospho-acceptor domain-containing protein [Pyrinomonadaceae bacterium]
MNEDEACAADRGDERATTEGLRRTVATYEARLTEIADLTARVRHEINNPLTGLIGQAQLLLRVDLDDSARRRVEIIERLASRIRDVVAELRVIQRPTAPTTDAADNDQPTTDDETASDDSSASHSDNDPPRH